MKRILECSSAGDKRFSAFYARIDFYGTWDSIEHHYQSVKRNKAGHPVAKGERVDHIIIFNGATQLKLEPSWLTPLYRLMWCCYLDRHPELVEHAKGYDAFTDKFRGKAINCQADVIGKYVLEGRKSILEEQDVIELRRKLQC